MRTVPFFSILAVSGLAAFACADGDEGLPTNTAGAAGAQSAAGQSSAAGDGSGGEADPSRGGGGGDAGSPGMGAGGAMNDGGAGEGGSAEAGGAGGAGGAASAGDGGAGGEQPAHGVGFELLGSWHDSFDFDFEITPRKWDSQIIQDFDNDANVAFTQNPKNALYGPSKFNKIVYVGPTDDVFYYCTIAYGKDSLAAAQADTQVADSNDLDGHGCSGFSWSKATRK